MIIIINLINNTFSKLYFNSYLNYLIIRHSKPTNKELEIKYELHSKSKFTNKSKSAYVFK